MDLVTVLKIFFLPLLFMYGNYPVMGRSIEKGKKCREIIFVSFDFSVRRVIIIKDEGKGGKRERSR